MSTRCAIIVHTPPAGRTLPGIPAAEFTAIYCHSDGYPAWTGHLLHTRFPAHRDAAALVALGDISGIGRDATVDAYHRDRGEPWDQVCPLHCSTAAEAADLISNDGNVYLFLSGRWTHNGQDLATVLAEPDNARQILRFNLATA